MTVSNNVLNIINEIKSTDHPALKSLNLSLYISENLREKKLNIYEAYLLQGEVIRYTRDSYIMPAWSGKVQISTCLNLLNQKLLALAFNDIGYMKNIEKWSTEALQLCVEKRKHYIMDKYSEFLSIDFDSRDLLLELLNVREKYDSLSYDDGPYHTEVFPYDEFEPEKILLERSDLSKEKFISKDIETLLIELNC